MNTDKLIVKIMVKLVVFLILVPIAYTIGQVMAPILSTELAMGQMENSDAAYVAIVSAQNIYRIVKYVLVGIGLCFAGSIACDVYNFINNKKEK